VKDLQWQNLSNGGKYGAVGVASLISLPLLSSYTPNPGMFRSGSYLSAGTCLVSLATLCLGSHDKIHQAILLSFYILQVIKNWSWGRHEAKTLPITRRAWKRCLIDACTDCTCTSTVTNRQSWWNSFSPGRYPFAVKSKWLWFVSVFIRPDYLRCVGGKLLECWYSHVNGRFAL